MTLTTACKLSIPIVKCKSGQIKSRPVAAAAFLYVLGVEKTMFPYLLFTIGKRRFSTEFPAENLVLSRFLFQRRVITKLLQDSQSTALQ